MERRYQARVGLCFDRKPVGTSLENAVVVGSSTMMSHLGRGAAALLFIGTAGLASAPALIAGAADAETFGPGAPVTLTDAQRAKILRAIVIEHGAAGPAGRQRVIDEPSRPPAHSQPEFSVPSGDVAVGTTVPETLPVTPLPDSVGVEVPALRHSGYALVGGRLLLVDPTSSMVLGEISR
jgi:Protein of unknown function (DUF1236)